MWCHLVLAMPFLSLGLFLVLPWWVALPVYLPIAASSAILYRQLMRDMHVKPKVGAEALIGARGTVLSLLPRGSRGTYLLRVGSERWIARASGELRPGDQAEVTEIDGMCLVVEGKPRAFLDSSVRGPSGQLGDHVQEASSCPSCWPCGKRSGEAWKLSGWACHPGWGGDGWTDSPLVCTPAARTGARPGRCHGHPPHRWTVWWAAWAVS